MLKTERREQRSEGWIAMCGVLLCFGFRPSFGAPISAFGFQLSSRGALRLTIVEWLGRVCMRPDIRGAPRLITVQAFPRIAV